MTTTTTDIPAPEKKRSIVARRLAELEGRTFDVRVSWAEDRTFRGTFRAAHPVGRQIFLAFDVGGKRRLVNSERVLELAEVAGDHVELGADVAHRGAPVARATSSGGAA